MPAFLAWPVLRAFLGGAVQKLVQWLSHRSFWQLVCMGLACVIVVQHFTLVRERKNEAAYLKQRDGYKAQLDAISTKRDQQKVVTKRNIETVTKIVHDADTRAKVVETAPPAVGCKTKPEVLQADL